MVLDKKEMNGLIENFKRDLRSYVVDLDYKRIYNEKLEALRYEMSGVKGIDYSKQKGSYNASNAFKMYFYLSTEIEKVEKLLEITKKNIKKMEEYLDFFDEKEKKIIIDLWGNNIPYREVQIKHNYSSIKKMISDMNGKIEEMLRKKIGI